jgi:hypothetical protein
MASAGRKTAGRAIGKPRRPGKQRSVHCINTAADRDWPPGGTRHHGLYRQIAALGCEPFLSRARHMFRNIFAD